MAANQYVEALTKMLEAFPAQLQQLLAFFPPDRLKWKPLTWDGIPSERLTALEQVCHLRDIEVDGYHVRFQRTRGEVRPVLVDLPGEAMAIQRRYLELDPALMFREFTEARALTVETVRSFSANELGREAIFEGRATTLLGLVHFLCSHDHQHLSGLQWLLAKSEQR